MKLASGSTDRLNLPVLPANVVRQDGSNALLSQPVLVDGAPVSGAYDLVVLSSASSTVPVVVNNVAVAPGEQKTVPAFDFALTGGRLNLPIRAGGAGQATILVTSGAPEFPVLTAVVQAWQPQVQLSADPGWSVQPLVQTHKIGSAAGSGTPCRLTYDEAQAREADPIDDPVCLVEFTTKPPSYQLKDGLLQGVLKPADPLAVEYQVALYNGGVKYILATGSQAIARLPITDVTVEVKPSLPSPVYRKVQQLTVEAKTSGKLSCRVTGDAAEARRLGDYELACLVRWQAMPAGLSADASAPRLAGKLADAGDQTISWAVDVYTPDGLAADVSGGSQTITVQEPPAPTLTLQPGLYGQAVDESNYITTAEGPGEVGSVQFKPPMDQVGMSLRVEVDGAAETYLYQAVRAVTFSRFLRLGAMAVWESKDLQVTLSYTDLPEKTAEKSLRVTAAPAKRLNAYLTAERVGSSTTGLAVDLRLGRQVSGRVAYDKAQEGEWEVEFGTIAGVGDYRPLTSREPLPDSGHLHKTLIPPLGNVKLIALLSLKPPPSASFYSRTLWSSKAYAQILKGEAPAGQISSRVASGPALLHVMPTLKVGSDDMRVLGSVAWQLSRDNGATWTPLTGMQPFMAQIKLPPGQYLVRAELENKISKVKGYTNQLAFTSYDVPDLAVSGPAAVIVNTPLTLQAALTNQGAAVDPSEATIQWYRHDRTGETLVHTGPTYTATPGDLGSRQYVVRASLKSAVATDAKAWRQQMRVVRVVAPAPPEVRLLAPNQMEYNTKEAQTYQLKAQASLRSGLDSATYPVEGEWELPDGTKVTGAEASYSPTAADAAKRKSLVIYRAWIRGMKESTGATVLKSIPLTIYDWPTFSILTNAAYTMAPSLVTLSAMPSTGKPWTLEKPQYTWSLPDGAAVVKTMDNSRVLQVIFPAAGNHTVAVAIEDARGSTATAAAMVNLAEPPAYQVSFQPLYSNPGRQEPLNVTVRPRFSGGHPADRITGLTYSTDAPGATVFDSLGQVQGLRAGNHTVTVTAATRFGKTVTADLPVEVLANQPPACTVTTRRDARYVYLSAACSDPDGRVAAYRWYRHDRVVSCSNRVTLSLADAATSLDFEAIDNSGAKYQETITPNTGG